MKYNLPVSRNQLPISKSESASQSHDIVRVDPLPQRVQLVQIRTIHVPQRSIEYCVIWIKRCITYILTVLNGDVTDTFGTLANGIIKITVVRRILPSKKDVERKVDVVTGWRISCRCRVMAQDGR